MVILSRRGRGPVVYRGQPLKVWCVLAYQGNTNAVDVLKELGTNAMPDLIRLLRERDSFVRKQAWTHLPRLPSPVRRTIAQQYAPPQAEVVREAAARALGRLGAEAKVAIPPLAKGLRDKEGRVRWEAASALGSIGQDSVPALINALGDNDARTRHAAAYALGQMGAEAVTAVPALSRSLNDQDQTVRDSAAYSLTAIGTPGFLALIQASGQIQEPARIVATRMLTNSYLTHFRTISEFYLMAQDALPATRKQALEALRAIRAASSLAIQASLSALDDPATEVCLAAIQTLGARAGTNQHAVQALITCLNAESPRIREEAARALGNIGDPARVACPELARLMQDPEKSVSIAAQQAMEKIGQE